MKIWVILCVTAVAPLHGCLETCGRFSRLALMVRMRHWIQEWHWFWLLYSFKTFNYSDISEILPKFSQFSEELALIINNFFTNNCFRVKITHCFQWRWLLYWIKTAINRSIIDWMNGILRKLFFRIYKIGLTFDNMWEYIEMIGKEVRI